MKAEFSPAAEAAPTTGKARTGVVSTPRGEFATPCFMPVGTRAAVRHLSAVDLEDLGVQVVLANTYHLMLRPGAEVVAELGGIHRFTGWDGHVLTDSGGYQVFSLDATVDDDGATFKSVYDGSRHRLTAEEAVRIQHLIGSDITMVLDVCPPAEAPRATHQSAADRTVAWAQRARRAFLEMPSSSEVCQFGIVQGGAFGDLRQRCAQQITEIDFDGYAVGGLSVGEERPAMLDAVDACVSELPTDRPRYFMGLGDPVGIVECVARGVDMFDCVLPTRLARHGTVLCDSGRYNLANAANARSDEPLDPSFPQSPAARFSRGYLRHLLNTREPTAARILTLHNLAWMLRLMRLVRSSITDGTFEALRAEVHASWA